MLYEFKLGHNAAEATKNSPCVKGEDAVDHNTISRWFKKFCSVCKDPQQSERTSRPNTMDFKAGF